MKMTMNNFINKIKNFFSNLIKDPLFLNRWESSYSRRVVHEDQKTVYISGRRHRKPYPYNNDSSMFIDDMYMDIMPFMHQRGARNNYPVLVTPQISSNIERMIAEGISRNEHNYQLEDAVCEFIRSTSRILFQEGVAYFEINKSVDEEGEIEGFEFQPVNQYGLYSIGTFYYQFISWRDAVIDKTRVQIVKIPSSKMLKIELPKNLISKRKYKNLLKRLYFSSQETVPSFQMESIKQNKSVGFDMDIFSRNKYIEKAISTKDFGWNQRQYLKDKNYITEYYSMVRFLRKKKVQAMIRELLFNKLNEALNSSILNLGVKIEMENLFTVEDVNEQERLLSRGDIKFMDIFNNLKI